MTSTLLLVLVLAVLVSYNGANATQLKHLRIGAVPGAVSQPNNGLGQKWKSFTGKAASMMNNAKTSVQEATKNSGIAIMKAKADAAAIVKSATAEMKRATEKAKEKAKQRLRDSSDAQARQKAEELRLKKEEEALVKKETDEEIKAAADNAQQIIADAQAKVEEVKTEQALEVKIAKAEQGGSTTVMTDATVAGTDTDSLTSNLPVANVISETPNTGESGVEAAQAFTQAANEKIAEVMELVTTVSGVLASSTLTSSDVIEAGISTKPDGSYVVGESIPTVTPPHTGGESGADAAKAFTEAAKEKLDELSDLVTTVAGVLASTPLSSSTVTAAGISQNEDGSFVVGSSGIKADPIE